MATKYHVDVTPAERAQLEAVVTTGTAPARTITHARILLKADRGPGGPHWPDDQIGAALDVSLATIHRVRQRFVEAGLLEALQRQPPPPRLRKLDGEQEAHLIALHCGPPPPGYARWSLRLLADRYVALGYGDPVSHETVRVVL